MKLMIWLVKTSNRTEGVKIMLYHNLIWFEIDYRCTLTIHVTFFQVRWYGKKWDYRLHILAERFDRISEPYRNNMRFVVLYPVQILTSFPCYVFAYYVTRQNFYMLAGDENLHHEKNEMYYL